MPVALSREKIRTAEHSYDIWREAQEAAEVISREAMTASSGQWSFRLLRVTS